MKNSFLKISTHLYKPVLSGILLIVIFVVYSNSYSGNFLYDDINIVVKNEFLHKWHYLLDIFSNSLTAGSNVSNTYYRPLQEVFYLITIQVFGLSAPALHGLNICLHAANACLVFQLGRKLGFKTSGAFVAALLWALHPIHTEAVAYISATADPLYAFFSLLGAIVVLPDFSPRRILMAGGLLILALFSKESAASFVLIAACLLYYKNEDRFNYRIYLRLWPLAAITVAYIVFHSALLLHQPKPPMMIAAKSTFSVLLGLMPFSILPRDLLLILWPVNLYMGHVVDSTEPWTYLGLVTGFLLVIVCIWQVSGNQSVRDKSLSFGILWFAAALLPVASIGDIFYEHWLYLATIGLFLGVMEAVANTESRLTGISTRHLKLLNFCVSVGLASTLGVLTWKQNFIWRSPLTLYSNIIQQGHPAPEAHIGLGQYYAMESNYGAALQQYRIAEEEFGFSKNISTVSNISVLENNIGMTMLAMQPDKAEIDEAFEHLKKAVEADPNNYLALRNLAAFYQAQGNSQEASIYSARAEALRQAFGNQPGNGSP